MGSRLRVLIALLAAACIATAVFFRLSQFCRSTIAYEEARGLGGALIVGLLFVGFNALAHRGRRITWRSRLPAAWAGSVAGIASGKAGFSSAPPSDLDWICDAVALDGFTEPARIFGDAFGAGSLAVAVFLQLSFFLIAAARLTYSEPTWQRRVSARLVKWHYGKILILWAGVLVAGLILKPFDGDLWWPWYFVFAGVAIGVSAATWAWLSAREKEPPSAPEP